MKMWETCTSGILTHLAPHRYNGRCGQLTIPENTIHTPFFCKQHIVEGSQLLISFQYKQTSQGSLVFF